MNLGAPNSPLIYGAFAGKPRKIDITPTPATYFCLLFSDSFSDSRFLLKRLPIYQFLFFILGKGMAEESSGANAGKGGGGGFPGAISLPYAANDETLIAPVALGANR